MKRMGISSFLLEWPMLMPVTLIQLNDMYDVCVALKQVNVMKILMADIYDDVFPADDFMVRRIYFVFLLTDYQVLSETVQNQLRNRLGRTHDSRAKVWLTESIEEMGELSTPLITLVKRSWTVYFLFFFKVGWLFTLCRMSHLFRSLTSFWILSKKHWRKPQRPWSSQRSLHLIFPCLMMW